MTYEIVCTRGPMKGRRWAVTSQGLKIGRAEGCEIQVGDVSVALYHCVVKLEGGKPIVANLASDNGVDVNGDCVDEAELVSMDKINVGGARFVISAVGGGRGGAILRKVVPLAILLVLAATGAYLCLQNSKSKAVVPAAKGEKPVGEAVTTNRVVRVVDELIVTTNRIINIVNNIVVTNYVVEVRRNGELVSSVTLQDEGRTGKQVKLDGLPRVSAAMKQDVPKGLEEAGKEREIELPHYEVIDSKKAISMGGASGGDEVRLVVNTNGTCDIIHIFTEVSVVKTLVVPGNNGIIPRSARFLVVGGGGCGTIFGCGGAGGVVVSDSITLTPQTAYIYVGSVGRKHALFEGHGGNGEDSILSICGRSYTAIGGGRVGGYSGGSGGSMSRVDLNWKGSALGLQALSPTGGLGINGVVSNKGCRCGGGPAYKSDVSGRYKVYACGGIYEGCVIHSGIHSVGAYGSGMNKSGMGGSGGIIVVRYSVKDSKARGLPIDAKPTFPRADKNVRHKRIDGIVWSYIISKDGSVTIGCHDEGGCNFPDLWLPAIDRNVSRDTVIIPARIDGRPVKKIGRGAFQGSENVRHYVVPEGVVECEARAFARCPQLESVSYPRSLERLGEGQVYRSCKVVYLRFLSSPPKCVRGCCPFKGMVTWDVGTANIVVPFSKANEWRNDGCELGAQYQCSDGCHEFFCLVSPSNEEQMRASKTNAQFASAEFSRDASNGKETSSDSLSQLVTATWRKYGSSGIGHVSSNCCVSLLKVYMTSAVPKEKAVVFVSMMHFGAREEVDFKYYFQHGGNVSALVMVDDDLVLVPVYAGGWRIIRGKRVKFDKDGWHRIAIVVATRNGDRGFGGGVFYKRGDGPWRMFEANPDGSEFRLTREDARRAVADIERARAKEK